MYSMEKKDIQVDICNGLYWTLKIIIIFKNYILVSDDSKENLNVEVGNMFIMNRYQREVWMYRTWNFQKLCYFLQPSCHFHSTQLIYCYPDVKEIHHPKLKK